MSKKSSKPDLDKEIISPNTRIIRIGHALGDQTLIQKLTVPRRRRFTNVYQFKCILRDTKPPVWRRIQVPESYTFYDFHVAIQDAMDWLDYHLHHFSVSHKEQKGVRIHIECPWWEPWEMDDDWLVTTEVPIQDYFKKPSDKATYRYDYGDSWEMSINLEKILPKLKNVRYPVCLGGKLAAPPEDCGSIPGYYQCIEAFDAADELEKHPDTEEKYELRERLVWLGDWNPYGFDPEKIDFENPRERFIMALDLK